MLYKKVTQLYIYISMCILFIFFSIMIYHKILNRAPCVSRTLFIQSVYVLFFVSLKTETLS